MTNCCFIAGVQPAIRVLCLAGMLVAAFASSADEGSGGRPATYAQWGGAVGNNSSADLPRNGGVMAIRALEDLESGVNTGVVGLFVGLPQPRMVQVRLLLEKELLASDLSGEEVDRMLILFDRTIGSTAQGVAGNTFSLTGAAVSVDNLQAGSRAYLSALFAGKVRDAADLRTRIATGQAKGYEALGYSKSEALNLANTELSLTSDLLAVQAGIAGDALESTVRLSLIGQGLPEASASHLGAGLAKLSTNTTGIGAGLQQSQKRYSLGLGSDGEFHSETASSAGAPGRLFSQLSARWAQLTQMKLSVGGGSIEKEDFFEVKKADLNSLAEQQGARLRTLTDKASSANMVLDRVQR